MGLLVMVKPLVSWIWASVALMALGGIIAVVPRRRVAAALLAEAPDAALPRPGGETGAMNR